MNEYHPLMVAIGAIAAIWIVCMQNKFIHRLDLWNSLFVFTIIMYCSFNSIYAQSKGGEARLVLRLPTDNHALWRGDLKNFYAPTVSGRLISGMYGFTRSSVEPPRIFNRFHEGIDIKPLKRDSKGDPVDFILAAGDGIVEHVTDDPTKSNYGHYVVIRHSVGAYPIYTLYAHNAENFIRVGQRVRAGDRIARMGYTGSGINQARAHLHFEVGFKIQRNFAEWFEARGRTHEADQNHHENMNGMNLLGVDPIPILKASRNGYGMSIKEIFAMQKPCFKVRIPADGHPYDYQKRYDFVNQPGIANPRSWLVTCSEIGLPLRFEPSGIDVSKVELVWFDYSRSMQRSMTPDLVLRAVRGRSARLLPGGERFFDMLMWR